MPKYLNKEDGGEVALDGVVLSCVGITQTRVFRRLISWAMPEIRSVARAIWSRQRAITAGLDGSIARSETGPTAWDARSQRRDASGSQRTGSRPAARLGDCWNCWATRSRFLWACSA